MLQKLAASLANILFFTHYITHANAKIISICPAQVLARVHVYSGGAASFCSICFNLHVRMALAFAANFRY